MAWPSLRRDTGGRTPKASQVRKTTVSGWPAACGRWNVGMWWIGYDTRPLGVLDVSA